MRGQKSVRFRDSDSGPDFDSDSVPVSDSGPDSDSDQIQIRARIRIGIQMSVPGSDLEYIYQALIVILIRNPE